jgi:molybdenum cofactor cytidylyltransferase
MGVSLACAAQAAADADGWVVALADMPWIAPATIDAVAGALRDGAPLVAPTFRGIRGHPVGFAGAFGPQLRALTGDEGARVILSAHLPSLRLIEVADPGIVRDVDRPEDLRGA